MTKQKTTKKTLLTSVLSLVLCMAMLIGTTFAWFTDSVTSGKNRIQAGNLDVAMSYKNTSMADYDDVETPTSPDFFKDINGEQILWEPGAVAYANFKVENKGTLALKYSLETIIAGCNYTVDGKSLADVLTVKVIKDEVTYATREDAVTAAKGSTDTLESFAYVNTNMEKDTTDYFTVVLYWEPSSNDNEFNVDPALWIDIELSLVATQAVNEEDSFDNEYDKNAIYYDVLVTSADELYNAVATASGDVVIAIDGNITLTKALSKSGLRSIKFVAYDEDATLDQATYHMYLAGAKVTFEGLTLTHADKPYQGDGGQAAESFIVWYAVEVNYVDCIFNRSVGTLHASVHNFIGCTFNGVYNPNNTLSEYPLNNYDSEETNVIDCVFNCTNRGAILFYGDNTTGEYILNISDTYFLGNIIADKTAVEIHSRGTSIYNVNIKNTVVGDGVVNGLYRIKPANEGTVNVNVDTDSISYVATASNSSALATAISKAKAGDTIYLNTDIDCGAGQLAIEKDVTIDLNNQTLSADYGWGIISMKNGASIKNGTIDVQSNVAAIRAFEVGSIENVTINIMPKATEKVATGIAVQNGGHVGTIKNVTITGATQGIEIGKGAKVDLIENAKVQAVSNGSKQGTALLINAGYVGKAVRCSFKGEVYGVHMMLNGENTVTLELKECTVVGAKAGIYAHDEVGISNTNNCSLTLTYDAESIINGGLVWDFEDECKSVITLNAPSGN